MDWHSLGIKLGMEICQLSRIENDNDRKTVRCKHEMLDCCLRSAKILTWKSVTDALRQMEEHEVASKIERKHCNFATANGMCLLYKVYLHSLQFSL